MLPVNSGPTGNFNGTTPTVNQTYTMTVTWALAPGCPNPDYFEVIAFTGSDPTNDSTWVFPPACTKDGTARSLSIAYALAAAPGALTAAVRSVYLSGNTQSAAPVRSSPIASPLGGNL